MDTPGAWALFTRLGEAQLLLPAMGAALLWLAADPATRPLARAWAGATAGAAALTLASKLAFIGWGLGVAALDFTGISGHALFAATVLPVLARVAVGRAPAPVPRLAVAGGLLLAAAVAYSRLPTQAHSASEAAAGWALGAAASSWALRTTPAPRGATPRWLPAGVAAWLLVLPLLAPASRSHDAVTAAALALSGRERPYTRVHLHRHARLVAAPGVTGAVLLQSRALPTAVEHQRQPVRQGQLPGHGVR